MTEILINFQNETIAAETFSSLRMVQSVIVERLMCGQEQPLKVPKGSPDCCCWMPGLSEWSCCTCPCRANLRRTAADWC